jgi:hypothetical protein
MTRNEEAEMHFRTIQQFAAALALACLLAVSTAFAQSPEYKAALDGASEVPPVQTHARGEVSLMLEPESRIISWTFKFSGLSGPPTAAHFHGPAAFGENARPIISIPATALTSLSVGVATLSPAQVDALEAENLYFNIHTAAHPAGEIRGQLLLVK